METILVARLATCDLEKCMSPAFGHLNRLKVKGFKSIREADVELTPLNILVGANGAGKSNFIALFKFMHRLQSGELQLYTGKQGGPDRIMHFGTKRTEAIDIRLTFAPNAYHCRLGSTVTNGLLFEQEECYFDGHQTGGAYRGGRKTYKLAPAGALESGLPHQGVTPTTAAGYVSRYISDWRVYHFHDTGENARVKQNAKLADNLRLAPDASNLPAFLYRIRDTEEYRAIVKAVSRVASYFQDFVLEPEEDGSRTIRLRWRHRGSDDLFDVADLSDGTLRFICLATLLHQPKPPTAILLDEPELGLHPHAIQVLAGMLRSASKQSQIIASTQSVTLANQFALDDIVVVDRKDEASVFRRLNAVDYEQWLDDYGSGDLWEKNIIGGTPT